MSDDVIHAPWSEIEVLHLNAFQHDDIFHPYTCVCQEKLVATKDGWFCPSCNGIVQTNALKISAEAEIK